MDEEVRKKVETEFANRMKFQRIKYASKEFHKRKVEFFCGAMSAIGGTPDPKWSIEIMTDRCIVEPYKLD